MRIVVCDAGPILHLSEASAFGLLERLGEIFIPTAVDQEVARHLADWPAAGATSPRCSTMVRHGGRHGIVDRTLDLADTAKAHEVMTGGDFFGKLVLRVPSTARAITCP